MTREALLAAFEAAAARVVPLDGMSKLARLSRLKGRYASYALRRLTPGPSTAPLFWGKPMRTGPAGHSAPLHLFGLLEASAELKLTRWLIKTLDPSDAFVDVGANFGFYSLLAQELGVAKIAAFEPVPAVFALLTENASGTRIEPRRLAVSDREGRIAFDEAPPTHPGGSTVDAAAWVAPGSPMLDFKRIEVDATTLDAFCAAGKFVPTVVKIDVEGAEDRVVAGARATLTRHSPSVVIEVWKPPVVNKTHHAAIASLRALDYRAHAITDGGGLAPLDDAGVSRELSGGETANLVFKKHA